MPLVSEVCEYLDDLAPAELAEEWDNVGLLVGRETAAADCILTCLTLTPTVAAEALDRGVQMIVSHHPVLFRGAKKITNRSAEGQMLLDLIQAGIAVYSAHTRFDSARDGINQQLATAFGLIDAEPLRPSEALPGLGSGRFGRLPEPRPLADFLRTVRMVTDAQYLEFCGDKGAAVSVVGVACGSAAEFLADVAAKGCDTFVTGEARFHFVLDAQTRGISVILPGHYASERPAMEWLARKLETVLPGLTVWPSERELDPLGVFA